MITYDAATRMAGHKLVAGFEGSTLPEEMIRLVRKHKVSNVILFRRNIVSGEQLARLCREIQALVQRETGASALITIDQEGGSVTRLPAGYTVFPSQMAVAASGNPENAYEVARMTGRQLRALGVNFNLAPVMDLNLNPNNPVIGTRSFSDRPGVAESFGTASIRGYREAGVFASAKHFPGHGDTAVDSHVGLPTVDKSLDEMWATELLSFDSAVRSGVPSVMVSHILYPKLQENPVPATMSRDIITGLLKEKMHFTGLAISDCMMMDAILKYYGTVEGCIASAKAGMDLIFVSHDPALAAKAAEGIRDMILSGGISENEAIASEQKVLAAKAEVAARDQVSLTSNESAAMQQKSAAIAAEALSLFGADSLPVMGRNSLFVGMPAAKAGQASDDLLQGISFPQVLSKAVGGQAYETDGELSERDIPCVLSAANGADAAILGVQGIRLTQAEEDLLKALLGLDIPVVCVALRTPYPLSGLPGGVIGLAAFDYSEDSLNALAEVFLHKVVPSGRMPVYL